MMLQFLSVPTWSLCSFKVSSICLSPGVNLMTSGGSGSVKEEVIITLFKSSLQ